jgi:hypothetical protein
MPICLVCYNVSARVADPDSSFQFRVDRDPPFYFNADPDPGTAPYQSDANLRHWSPDPPELNLEPRHLFCERPRPWPAQCTAPF